MAPRLSFCWVVVLPFFFFLSTARADSGDIGFSLEAVGDSAPATGLNGSFRYGFSDVFSFETGLGARLSGSLDHVTAGAIGYLGGVAALDVFSWVPELSLGVGSTLAQGEYDPLAYLRLKCRWVLDFNWSLFIGGEAAISFNNPRFSGSGRIGFSYQLD